MKPPPTQPSFTLLLASVRWAVHSLFDGLRDRGLPVILISHNMPNVFEVADRIHIQRLGRRVAVITPSTHTPSEAVAIMTGALDVEPSGPVH